MNLNEHISELIQLSKSKMGKDSAIVLFGNLFGSGLGFLATILVTRTLGPAQFGIFSLALAVMGIATQISDLGISTGLVRFASLYLKTDLQKANLMFKVSLKLKLIISMIVFIIGFLSSEALAIYIFENPQLIFPFKLAFIGALGSSLAGYISITLQSRQSFVKFTYINLISPFMRLIITVLLYLTYNLNLSSALITVITLPFMAFLIGSLIIPRDFLKTEGNEKEVLHQLYHFSKWILVSVFCVMIFQQLDVLMLGSLKSAEEVGYYSAAAQIPSAIILITGSLTTVLLPLTCALTGKHSIIYFVKKSLKYTSLIALAMTPVLIIAGPLMLLVYGNQYENSITVFKILFTIRLLDIIISPLGLIYYIDNRPEIPAFVNLSQLIGNFIGNYLLIPDYGAIGAAFATLIVYAIGGLYVFWYIYFKVIKE
jgi:O-antigen/teichoic acid export membrane protein